MQLLSKHSFEPDKNPEWAVVYLLQEIQLYWEWKKFMCIFRIIMCAFSRQYWVVIVVWLLQSVSRHWTATINMTSPVHKIYELFLVQRDLSQFSIDDRKKVGLESDPQFP